MTDTPSPDAARQAEDFYRFVELERRIAELKEEIAIIQNVYDARLRDLRATTDRLTAVEDALVWLAVNCFWIWPGTAENPPHDGTRAGKLAAILEAVGKAKGAGQ